MTPNDTWGRGVSKIGLKSFTYYLNGPLDLCLPNVFTKTTSSNNFLITNQMKEFEKDVTKQINLC